MSKRFYLPPEWHAQDAVMLTWPHQDTDWAIRLVEVEPVFINIVHAISNKQKVVIVCHDAKLQQDVKAKLEQANINLQAIIWVIQASNDTWARDHGPITTCQGNNIEALNYTFNGWGNKYPSQYDNLINDGLFATCQVEHHKTTEWVLEGGAIDIDEQGHLLTTEACLLNQNRNPNLNQSQIEDKLGKELGARKILWLQSGALEGDDTDSHIDTLARFAPGQIIVYQGCQDETDSHFTELNAMKQQLEAFTTVDGLPFILFELPWPDAQFNKQGERLPATYANFLVINQAVLVPIYGVAQDKKALIVIQMAFPDHEIIPIDCRPIIEQFGSLHCLTMQLPKGFLANIPRG
ncbi:agmatine deiminase [Saccharobesus litoralis]|uniref:Agmatine deiminase n=1 Tax=Saccharobesus litoralis TaxID=2172099 RepID=A0A2S0VTD3_9ALTE|nr:agmatine deiminase family protein [Saccharobesus litoralis]AWB67442.1 agmatine deiminase [Saccharobesus litoralis]